jgi:serine/threonine protein kinase
MLEPTFEERETEPFATGGFSDVYKATLDGRLVAIKTLRVITTTDLEKLRKVSGLIPTALKWSLTLDPKHLINEVVGWKWLQHENILPFIGVTMTSPFFSIVSERMTGGTIMNFVKAHPDHNPLRLVSSEIHLSSYPADCLWIAHRCCDRVRLPASARHYSWRSQRSEPVVRCV